MDFVLQNERDRPTWFIIRATRPAPPPADDRIRCGGDPLHVNIDDFRGYLRSGEMVDAPVVRVTCAAVDTLLKLPPGQTVTVARISVAFSETRSFRRFPHIHIWESAGPLINGKPIDDWLGEELQLHPEVYVMADNPKFAGLGTYHHKSPGEREVPHEFDIRSIRHWTWIPDPAIDKPGYAYPELAPGSVNIERSGGR